MGELFLSRDFAPRMVIPELEVTPEEPVVLMAIPATFPCKALIRLTTFTLSISAVATLVVAYPTDRACLLTPKAVTTTSPSC